MMGTEAGLTGANGWPSCCDMPCIGIERQGWYDGVAYFQCQGCGTSYPRIGERFDLLWARRQAEIAAAPTGGET